MPDDAGQSGRKQTLMTNRNLRHAARAYQAAHGVNYTTALRAVTAARATAQQSSVDGRVPYGHPDYEAPTTTWETLRDLTNVLNRPDLRQQFTPAQVTAAEDAYNAIQQTLIRDAVDQIPGFLDDLASRLDPDTADLLNRSFIEVEAEIVLNDQFEDHWRVVESDDRYPEAVIHQIADGVVEWLRHGPQGPFSTAPSRNPAVGIEAARAILLALADATLDALDANEEINPGPNPTFHYWHARALHDEARALYLFARLHRYATDDIAYLLDRPALANLDPTTIPTGHNPLIDGPPTK